MSLTDPGPAWLFCPADRPERFEKAAAAADVVILDLEDGVAAKDREAARAALVASRLDPGRTVVRVNPSATTDHPRDLEAVARTPYTTVMLAKTESADQVRALAPLDVVVLVRELLARGATDIYRRVLAEVDRVVLTETLRQTGGNQVQASELLGISRVTLRTKLRALNLRPDRG